MARNDDGRVLYGFWFSPYMSAVAQVLEESGLDYTYQRVSPFQGATHTAEHTRRNPVGKVPSLEEADGLLVSDSQAICRYLARVYPEVRPLYPCDDPRRCAEIDGVSDFITFSISGPFFNWLVVGGYFPNAFKYKTEAESATFSHWSMLMIGDALTRLLGGAKMEPYLFGSELTLPDINLFHILALGKTLTELFDMPMIDIASGNPQLSAFYDAMAERPVSQGILSRQAAELPTSRKELFEEFGPAYADRLAPGRGLLEAMFGHEV